MALVIQGLQTLMNGLVLLPGFRLNTQQSCCTEDNQDLLPGISESHKKWKANQATGSWDLLPNSCAP